MRPKFLSIAASLAVLAGCIGPAQAQSFVEFLGSSRLTAKAATYGAQKEFDSALVPMRPDIRNENSLQVMGVERGACGVAGRSGKSIVSTSAQLNTSPIRFQLELVTALNVQGGFSAEGKEQRVPLGPRICIPGPSIETGAGAEASSEAVVEIRFNQDAIPGDYWLDLAFASRNSSGNREVKLRGPDGQVTTPLSDDPVLLRVVPNTSWFLEVAFNDKAYDAGKCCGKIQQASLQVSAAIRPAGNILEQQASGKQPDRAGQFDAVGLLVSSNLKGEPVPVCVATVVGRRSVLTAARCLLRFGIDRPSAGPPLWFVQNANVQAGLRRGLINVMGWSTRVSTLDPAIGAYNEAKADDRSAPYSRAGEEMAVVYVDADVGARATLHDGRTRLDALLSRTRYVGTLVSYGPSAATGRDDKSAVSWTRNLSEVLVMRDSPPDELLVRALGPNCGVDAGSPVFVEAGGVRVLVGILVSGGRDCQLKSGPRMESHIEWLRSQINKKGAP